MVRAPCCEMMGLKKGPWTPEEDRVLVSYVQRHGHDNWRALPKQAGLLRCGKSCRLRWTNYLRPDIKRGNFSDEEEESIIKLHQILGNRWSAIAARLPGRTDNEIKNFWHTHLKKKQKKKIYSADQNLATTPTNDIGHHFFKAPITPYQVSTQLSSLDQLSFVPFIKEEKEEEEEARPASSLLVSTMEEAISDNGSSSNVSEDDMVFWYNLFMKTGESRLFSL